MLLDRVEDGSHQVQVVEQRKNSEQAADCCKRAFTRRAELTDLARQYRRLNAELDTRDGKSQRLKAFYESEGQIVQEEIKELDKEIDNISKTYSIRSAL